MFQVVIYCESGPDPQLTSSQARKSRSQAMTLPLAPPCHSVARDGDNKYRGPQPPSPDPATLGIVAGGHHTKIRVRLTERTTANRLANQGVMGSGMTTLRVGRQCQESLSITRFPNLLLNTSSNSFRLPPIFYSGSLFSLIFKSHKTVFTITTVMATQRSATTQPPADSAVRAHTSAHLANSALLAQSDLSSLSSQQTLAAKPSLNSKSWTHTPSNLTLLWLCISLPLVIWDTSYVLLRPHSMPGGKYHYPLWAPYELYGRTDYVYGWKAWNEHNGFTAAQGWLNVVETVGYLCYLGLVFSFGVQSRGQGRGAPKGVGLWGWTRSVGGDAAGLATLVGFAASVMTLSKTVLYCKFKPIFPCTFINMARVE